MRRVLVLLVALALSGCWLQPGFGPGRQNANPLETGLTAANVDTLARVWSVPGVVGSNEPGRGQPLVSGSTVYTESTNNGAVIQARVRETGALRWERDDLLTERLLAVNDSEVLVYYLASDGQAFTVSARPGDRRHPAVRRPGVPQQQLHLPGQGFRRRHGHRLRDRGPCANRGHADRAQS